MSDNQIFLIASALSLLSADQVTVPEAHGPLTHAAYVWNRNLDDETLRDLREGCKAVRSTNVLVAEISWNDKSQSVRQNYLVQPEALSHLASACPEVSVSVRILPLRVQRDQEDRVIAALTDAISELHGGAARDWQIDFDAATAQISWFEVLMTRLAAARPNRIFTFTALPTWFEAREFGALARKFPNYTVQVHSLQRRGQGYTLYDSAQMWSTLVRAARLGVPFDLALPTYAHVLAIGEGGKLLAVQSEGPVKRLASTPRRRALVGADPETLRLDLLRLEARRPIALRNIVWFRVPTRADGLAWSLELWKSVMQLAPTEPPHLDIRLEARDQDPKLRHLVLENRMGRPVLVAGSATLAWRNVTDIPIFDLFVGAPLRYGEQGIYWFLGSETAPFIVRRGEKIVGGWTRGDVLLDASGLKVKEAM